MGSRAPRPIRRWGAATAAALLAGVAVTISGLVPNPPPAPTRAVMGALPPPVVPAFTPGPARPLASTRHLSHWAPVRQAVSARAAPDRSALVVATVSPTTPEGTENVVAVTGHRQDRAGLPWVRVRLAVLPNGASGWVPRAALGGYGTVDTHLRVELSTLQATLYRAGRPVFRAAVGVGMPGWPTPRGRFYVRNKLTRYRSPTYGPVAFGTSARSPVATDWPAGGFIGIHGTDRPDLIPGRISHGCIRLRNADILELERRMPVGTSVTIR
jgi:lipoprotein-anchoring transpeptidase ErfK/SrfK